MFASNTTSIAGKISPFVLHVVVFQNRMTFFVKCGILVDFSHAHIAYIIENESLDFYCMNSLGINNLSLVCLCLAPKLDRIKDYEDSAFLRIARLLN